MELKLERIDYKMEKKSDINVQEIANGIVRKVNKVKCEIRQLDREKVEIR